MKLELQFKEYLQVMKPLSNQPLRLETALKPFGIPTVESLSDDLLVGHLIDHMEAEWHANDVIDPIDVSVAAMELGHQAAEKFLDEAPSILVQLAKDLAS